MDTRLKRFGKNVPILRLPFEDPVHVLQGFDGPWTHQGHWKYALDFNMMNEHGKSHRENPSNPEDFLIFGKKVISPCHGWVESLEDQHDDRKIGFVDHDKNWGNYVLIRTSGNLFVLLSHLRKKSVQVKAGDRVYAGQPIGEVGNSGYSLEPHLHLHVQKNAFLGSETVPFSLETYASSSKKVRFYATPKVGELIEPLVENKALQFALSFKPGQKLVFERKDSKSPVQTIHVGLDNETGKWWLSDNEVNRLYFWHDSKHFYFYDLICEEDSILVQLMAALPMLPITYGTSISWNDYLPAKVQYRGARRILYDLKRLLWVPQTRKDSFYRMNSDGMKVRGRIIYHNNLTRTQVEIDPYRGIYSLEVGAIKWVRKFEAET
jgi:hypothetical protein